MVATHIKRWSTVCFVWLYLSDNTIFVILHLNMGGDIAQLIEHRTGTPPTQVQFSSVARNFSPRVNFQYRLSYGVHKPPCEITCIYICVHVKDPVVHVRVHWIMETLKQPACTLDWVAQLSNLAFPQGRQPKYPMGEIPLGQYSCHK